MALSHGTRLGAYEVLTLIGSGGFGEVYKARDTRLDRTVAIKILPSTDLYLRARLSGKPRRSLLSNIRTSALCMTLAIRMGPTIS
jgi:serine/threonine protein kinase